MPGSKGEYPVSSAARLYVYRLRPTNPKRRFTSEPPWPASATRSMFEENIETSTRPGWCSTSLRIPSTASARTVCPGFSTFVESDIQQQHTLVTRLLQSLPVKRLTMVGCSSIRKVARVDDVPKGRPQHKSQGIGNAVGHSEKLERHPRHIQTIARSNPIHLRRKRAGNSEHFSRSTAPANLGAYTGMPASPNACGIAPMWSS